jgi:hypothetical protein
VQLDVELLMLDVVTVVDVVDDDDDDAWLEVLPVDVLIDVDWLDEEVDDDEDGDGVEPGVIPCDADAGTVCQVPPNDSMPSPLAWPLDLSCAKRYSGNPRSVTCSFPSLRRRSARWPWTPEAALSFTVRERTVTGGQKAKQALFLHSRWWTVSPLRA